MNNEGARELYSKSGISYSDIGSKEIGHLVECLKYELEGFESDLKMKLCKLRKSDIEYNEDGTIKKCHLMVDGSYFKRREAISFNSKGTNGSEFIGFAGWASTNNVKPMITAFEKWVTQSM
jgi:hypothetical protein